MLYKVLEAGGGQLPNEAIVCFANTGKEDEATLKFVHDCETHWCVKITWLEYTVENEENAFKVVDYLTAARNGEPFDAVIKRYEPYLPNGRARYCSSQMKTRTMHRYLKSIGWEDWDTFIGIRADEPRRVSKFRANPHPETKHETICLPLVTTNISSKDVGKFWTEQSFDLGLPNMNGKTMHGNCDLCMLKPKAQILSLIQEKPERATWWIEQEKNAAKRCTGDGKYFAIDRPSYEEMYKYAAEQVDMFDKNEDPISCFCGD
jgi:3'-phosphoadenosine 5'-phosphosulfate sulfotransferase (PAPS reductase)/FAD synthetase